jgi:GNAT superfamily N-acetyltransferase
VPPDVTLHIESEGSGAVCRTILAALPSWFGHPESVESYVAAADANPTVVADVGERPAGLLTLVVHTPDAAEIEVMGVLPELHHQGIGRRLLASAEAWLGGRGVGFLQVKTLSPRHPDAGYAQTRAFYAACGFKALQEFPDLWRPEDPALQMIKTVPSSSLSPGPG